MSAFPAVLRPVKLILPAAALPAIPACACRPRTHRAGMLARGAG